MNSIEITIRGEPIPRPRALTKAVFNKKAGKWMGMAYHPENPKPDSKNSAMRAWYRANRWQGRVIAAAKLVAPPEPWTGLISLEITVWVPRPAKLLRAKDPEGAIPCGSAAEGDWDNFGKAISDALQTAKVYANDAQVFDARVRKFYHGKHAGPGARVVVTHHHDQLTLNGV